MPRNKTTARNGKRRLKEKATTDVLKMEKELIRVPTKLIAQLYKEIKNHKKQENKIKNAINKLKTQINKSETRIKSAENKADTVAGKKQLNKARKSHHQVLKAHDGLHKDLNKTTKSLENLENQQSRLIAFNKHISQFEKEWAKNSKKNDVEAVVKVEKKMRMNKKSNQTLAQQPQSDAIIVDNVRPEELTEIAS